MKIEIMTGVGEGGGRKVYERKFLNHVRLRQRVYIMVVFCSCSSNYFVV